MTQKFSQLLFDEFSDLFSKHSYDVGNFETVTHSIDIEPSHIVNCGSRRVPFALEEKVNNMVKEMLDNNIIRKSVSPFSAPIIVVLKKNRELRIYVDYRNLNKVTKRPVFHIPSAQEIFDKLGGNQYFSTIENTTE